jgi:hypothetical protein
MENEIEALEQSSLYSLLIARREIRDLFYHLWKKYDDDDPVVTFESTVGEFTEIIYYPILNMCENNEATPAKQELMRELRDKMEKLNQILFDYDEYDIINIICLAICRILQQKDQRILE